MSAASAPTDGQQSQSHQQPPQDGAQGAVNETPATPVLPELRAAAKVAVPPHKSASAKKAGAQRSSAGTTAGKAARVAKPDKDDAVKAVVDKIELAAEHSKASGNAWTEPNEAVRGQNATTKPQQAGRHTISTNKKREIVDNKRGMMTVPPAIAKLLGSEENLCVGLLPPTPDRFVPGASYAAIANAMSMDAESFEANEKYSVQQAAKRSEVIFVVAVSPMAPPTLYFGAVHEQPLTTPLSSRMTFIHMFDHSRVSTDLCIVQGHPAAITERVEVVKRNGTVMKGTNPNGADDIVQVWGFVKPGSAQLLVMPMWVLASSNYADRRARVMLVRKHAAAERDVDDATTAAPAARKTKGGAVEVFRTALAIQATTGVLGVFVVGSDIRVATKEAFTREMQKTLASVPTVRKVWTDARIRSRRHLVGSAPTLDEIVEVSVPPALGRCTLIVDHLPGPCPDDKWQKLAAELGGEVRIRNMFTAQIEVEVQVYKRYSMTCAAALGDFIINTEEVMRVYKAHV